MYSTYVDAEFYSPKTNTSCMWSCDDFCSRGLGLVQFVVECKLKKTSTQT